jgi:uncharacterized protein (DUF2236 family)
MSSEATEVVTEVVTDVATDGWLGPDSLSWRYSGDWRTILLGPWVGLVQLSLPGLGAGVVQHSAFYTEPWDRFLRSVPQIAGVVYDGPSAGAEGHRIRDLHTTIKGVDDKGRRYHALDPDVFFWAHATICEVVVKMVDLFDHPVSKAEKDQFYAESVQVWRNYGMSDRPVPANRAALEEYFADVYAGGLEKTPAVTEFIRLSREPGSMAQPWLPEPVWRRLAPFVMKPMWFLGVGMLEPEIREVLGLPWTSSDERKLRRLASIVRHVWPLVPRALRYMPRARAGFRRAGWPSTRRISAPPR